MTGDTLGRAVLLSCLLQEFFFTLKMDSVETQLNFHVFFMFFHKTGSNEGILVSWEPRRGRTGG